MISNYESVTLLLLQSVGILAIITQGDALGYVLIGLSSPFQPYSSNFF